MGVETPQISYELTNTAFCDKVFGGQIKEAMEAGSNYTRLRLYEDGILRRLFEYRMLAADELDPNIDNDQPSIIVELEPDASQATFVPYKGTGEHMYFNGKRYRVPFGKLEAERVSKSKFELMTIRMPITEWLKENQVKMIQQEEDGLFIQTLDKIVKDNASEQDLTFSMSGGTFKDAFTEGLKALTRLRLPDGKVLMHKNTFLDSQKLKTEDIGHVPQERRFEKGLEGEDTFMGHPIVTTIKDDLVKENELYFFTTQDYFCKFYLLQDATLFLETRADMIYFHTYESPGFGIGNTKGVVRVTLQ